LKLPDPLIKAHVPVPRLAQRKFAFTSVLFVVGISKTAKTEFNKRNIDLCNANVNVE
jgi:hypothetical protein